MSQMMGDLPFDLTQGMTWNAVLSISATGQPRRKVIAEFGVPGRLYPRITLQLNLLDHLSLAIWDRAGTCVRSPVILPAQFAGRVMFLQFETLPAETLSDNVARVRAVIRINGITISDFIATGDFGSPIKDAKQCFGATLEGDLPATFRLYELVVRVGTLTSSETAGLLEYFKQKHNILG